MNTVSTVVSEALGKGWQLTSETSTRATLTHRGTGGMDTGGHLLCGVLTLMSCGMFLPLWLGIAYYMYATSVPAETLIITDTGSGIEQKVVRS